MQGYELLTVWMVTFDPQAAELKAVVRTIYGPEFVLRNSEKLWQPCEIE